MQTRAFYAAALTSLRFVEHRSPTGRRFGDDADARWKAFKGHLTMADRIDLVLRDADVEFPGAFGARTAFALSGVAEDEPFGAHWSSLEPSEAETLWRKLVRDGAAPADVRAALAAMAAAWELALQPMTLPVITPTSRILAVGPSAVAALIEAFAGRSDLAWSDQVVCIATPPHHRQLAANAVALVRSTKRTALYTATDKIALAGDYLLVDSPDADPADHAAAKALRS